MPKVEKNVVKHGEKLFDTQEEPMPRGAWWWWFWMFYFNNPDDPDKPRQLMILWSTKNVKTIDCNGLEINIKRPLDRKNLDGAVAAWYFDGRKMHHNFLLEQCNIKVKDYGIFTDSDPETSFVIGEDRHIVKIGDDFEFIAEPRDDHEFVMPSYHANTFVGSKGYGITKINRLDLGGKVHGEPINGSAYFQRVFVSAPAVPWYWGSFHFANGGVLTYTNQMVLGKAIKKNVSFFDGKQLHELGDVTVKRLGGELPEFRVTSKTEDAEIAFTVKAYAHSSWTFRKKSLGVLPNKLVYNEYPSTITDFQFRDKKSGRRLLLGDLGKSVGNAEHTTGYLL